MLAGREIPIIKTKSEIEKIRIAGRMVGAVTAEKTRVMAGCREALWSGIRQVRPANRLKDVARAIEDSVNASGSYGIVEEYVGHGIGRQLHEAPQVPNYVSRKLEDCVL